MEFWSVLFGLCKELLSFLVVIIRPWMQEDNDEKNIGSRIASCIVLIGVAVIIVLVIWKHFGLTESSIDSNKESGTVQTIPKETQDDEYDVENEIVLEAQNLLKSQNYVDAITVLEEGKASYPDNDDIRDLYEKVKRDIENGIDQVLSDAQTLADDQYYDAAITLIMQGSKIYGDDARFTNRVEEFMLDASIAKAKEYALEFNYAEALVIIMRELEKYPLDIELIKLYNEYEPEFINKVLKSVDELYVSGEYDSAITEMINAMAVLPNCEEFEEKDAFIKANKPIMITEIDYDEQHTPDDMTSVNVGNWDEDSDLDIGMNRFGGGAKVEITDMQTSFGIESGNAIKSRFALLFSPSNHTEKAFSAVLVLDHSMFGSATYGTIRILVNNEEVFSTGKVDGSCEKSFPFTVDITGVSMVVFEADVVLKGGSFIYGIVEAR